MNNAYQKWLAGEGCCNAHNFINIEVPDCGREDVCDCENILEQISNLHTDDGILQEEIDYVSGVVDTISGGCDCDLSDYYTKEEVDALIPEVPSLSGYATEQWVLDKHYITGVDLSDYATHQWVENKNYLTEHQPLKTINGQVISGTGNIEITASGGTINVDYELDHTSTNPVVNSAITVAINAKLDASAYTPTEQVQSDWNEADTDSKAYIKNKPEIPVVPTSNSAFTNDMHYITSGDSVFNNYYTTGDTYTKTEVNNIVSNKIWCGTQAQYDAIQDKQNDVLYLIHS